MLGLLRCTEMNHILIGLVRAFQVSPPSVVRSIVEPFPTAIPVFESANETAERVLMTLLFIKDQVFPRSVERSIVPLFQTTITVLLSMKSTPYSQSVGKASTLVQVIPL